LSWPDKSIKEIRARKHRVETRGQGCPVKLAVDGR
jgi:hypothetical protein